MGVYHIDRSSDQVSISIETEKSKSRLLTSRNPKRELFRIAGDYRPKVGHLTIILGGIHFPLIREMSGAGCLLIVEKDLAIAKYISKLFSYSYVVSSASELEEFLENFVIEELRGYRVLKVPGSFLLAQKWYEERQDQLKKGLSSRISDMFTRLEFEPRWVFNAIMQLPFLRESFPVSSLFGKYRKATAILVSTGPSLRKSLPDLKIVASQPERFFIACVDSAWRVLYRNGIIPDLIISLDAQPQTLQHFLGLPTYPLTSRLTPWLVTDLVANPSVVRRWQGVRFFSVTAQYRGDRRVVTPGCEFVELILGQSPGDVQSGGSVATSAFDLLRQMEFSRICLVGQDFAYTYREIHCPGTHHSDQWYPITNRTRPIEQINNAVLHKRHTSVEMGIGKSPVHVDYILGLYRNWFSDAAKRVPNEVINASTDGAHIPNIPERQLEQIISQTIPVSSIPQLTSQDFQKLNPNFTQLNQLTHALKNHWSPELSEKFPFMNWIGRKFEIANLRSGKQNENLEQILAERKGFWSFLSRKLTLILGG